MLGCECKEGDAEDGIGTRRVDGYLCIERRRGQTELEALAPPDPVLLHRLNALGPAGQLCKIGEQLVGIVRDLKEPLREVFLLYFGFAAPAFPILDLLIGEHRSAGLAPVDRGRLFIRQPLFIKEFKEPLRPAIVILATGDDLAVPVVREPERTLLALHILNVRIRPLRRMYFVLDRRILGGHAKGIEPHRVQHIVSFHRAEARDHISDRIVADMPHVEFSRRIRKHLKHVILRFRIVLLRAAAVLCLPDFLPLRFNLLRAISLHYALAPPGLFYLI